MVLRSSSSVWGSSGIGAGVIGLEIHGLRSRVPSFCGRSRVSSYSSAGVRKLDSAAFGAPSVVVRMNAAPADGRYPTVTTEDDSASKTVMVRIRGKVQGVFYRNWTVETAKQLGVNGWVRNNKDGSVEAVFSGKPTAVDALIDKCEVGPPAAKVSNVEVTSYKDTVAEGFERKPTIW